MVDYSAAFRQQMVKRTTGPRARTASALADEVGVPQPTLSRWLRDAAAVASEAMTKSKASRRAKKARAVWSPAKKVEAVLPPASG